MKVLLAEDDPLSRFMLAEMLEELEIDCDVCADGLECVERFTRNPDEYTLVLMDIHMPILTGVEAAQKIREEHEARQRDVPILAVTADSKWQDPSLAAEAGFTQVLPKPVSFEALKEKITALVDTKPS